MSKSSQLQTSGRDRVEMQLRVLSGKEVARVDIEDVDASNLAHSYAAALLTRPSWPIADESSLQRVTVDGNTFQVRLSEPFNQPIVAGMRSYRRMWPDITDSDNLHAWTRLFGFGRAYIDCEVYCQRIPCKPSKTAKAGIMLAWSLYAMWAPAE